MLLYELLVGQLPWGGADAGLAMLIHRRVHDEAPPPTLLLNGLGADDLRRLAARRGVSTTAWTHRLRGDLDAVVSKAIARRPEERYDSAQSLARDIERHLAHEPIRARRKGRLYLLSKTLRRHRALAALGATLILGTVGTTLGLLEARRQTREALAARDESEGLSEVLAGLLRNARPANEAPGLSAEELLFRGRQLIASELEGQPRRRARLQAILGKIYAAWGLYAEAEPLLESAIETFLGDPSTYPEALRTLTRLAWLRHLQERFSEARALAEQALELARRTEQADDLVVARARIYLAHTLRELGEVDDSEAMIQQALARDDVARRLSPEVLATAYSGLAAVRMERRESESAVPLYQRALELEVAAHGADHHRAAPLLSNLARAFYRLRRYDEAEAAVQQALRIRETVFGPEAPQLTASLLTLGNCQRKAGRLDEAEATYQRAVVLLRRYKPESVDLSSVLQNLGHMLALMADRPEEGRPFLLEALERKEARGKQRKFLVTTLSSLGQLELKSGNAAAAEAYARRVLAIQEAVDYPNPSQTAQAWLELGRSLQAQGHMREAREAFETAKDGYQTIQREDMIPVVQKALDGLTTEPAWALRR